MRDPSIRAMAPSAMHSAVVRLEPRTTRAIVAKNMRIMREAHQAEDRVRKAAHRNWSAAAFRRKPAGFHRIVMFFIHRPLQSALQ